MKVREKEVMMMADGARRRVPVTLVNQLPPPCSVELTQLSYA